MKMEHSEHLWSIAKLYNRYYPFQISRTFLWIKRLSVYSTNYFFPLKLYFSDFNNLYVPKKSEIKVHENRILYRNSYHGLVVVEISFCKIIHKMSVMNKSD